MHPCQTGRLRAWFMQVIYGKEKKRNSSLTHAWLNYMYSVALHSLSLRFILSSFTLPCPPWEIKLEKNKHLSQYSSSPNSRIGWIYYLLHHSNEPVQRNHASPQKGTFKKNAGDQANRQRRFPILAGTKRKWNEQLLTRPLHRIVRFGPKSCPFFLINARGRMLAGLAPTGTTSTIVVPRLCVMNCSRTPYSHVFSKIR